METLRLKTLINPTLVSTLLESYVASRDDLPPEAWPESDPARMPPIFEQLIDAASRDGGVCRALVGSSNAVLFTANMSLERSRERGQPVLEIVRYDDRRRLKTRCIAAQGRDGQWREISE